jgi:hypothetical protein
MLGVRSKVQSRRPVDRKKHGPNGQLESEGLPPRPLTDDGAQVRSTHRLAACCDPGYARAVTEPDGR